MDTSKTYIEMCEKAVEIQSQKKRFKHPLMQKYISNLQDGDFYWNGFNVKPHDSQYSLGDPKDFKFVWLPRQDQLQEMITNKGYFRFSLIELFYNFANSHITLFESMEQLWIAFIMKTLYNKQWKENEWINQ